MVNVANRKQTVGVVFGSRSVEHDVSIVTAQQIIRALDPSRYEIVPIYISRRGDWLTGPALTDLKTFEVERIEELMGVRDTLISPSTDHHGMITPALSPMLSRNQLKRLDVVFPAIHGTHGEDGTLQGLCELADLPYVGCGVMASAVANNKALTKVIMRAHGIPVVEGITVKRGDWQQARAQVIESLDALGYPLFVKPAKLGSSIGIARPKDAKAAAAALDVAFNLDQTVVVEKALEGALEINCAVIGNHTPRPSLLEQPISFEEFLTYEEKYMRGGASKGMKGAERKIPAPLPQALTEQIQQMAVSAFKAIDGRGIARVDFLLKDGEVYLNEINTMPGSLAFYLWQAEGMTPAQVVDELIRLAHEAHKDKTRTMFDYKTGLVSLAAARGLKGVEGGKFGKKF